MSDVHVPSPKASRQSRPRWLDPKLFLGILLVLGSMALGAKIIGDADTTTSVYKIKPDVDITAGQQITADHLTSAQVRFTSQEDASEYISAHDKLPANTRALRDLRGGEFLPKDAISTEDQPDLRQFAIPVTPATSPKLEVGDRVNVGFVAKEGTAEKAEPEMALYDVLVVAAPEGGVIGADSAVTIQVPVETVKTGDGKPFNEIEFYDKLGSMRPYLGKYTAPGNRKK